VLDAALVALAILSPGDANQIRANQYIIHAILTVNTLRAISVAVGSYRYQCKAPVPIMRLKETGKSLALSFRQILFKTVAIILKFN